MDAPEQPLTFIKNDKNSFDIIEQGDYVLCAVSGKEINLNDLNYWNVDLQEAYFSPIEANERYQSLKGK